MTIRLRIDRLVIEDGGLASADRAALEAALVEALRAGLSERAASQAVPAPQRLRRLVGAPPQLRPAGSAAEAGAAIATSLIATLDAAGTLPGVAAPAWGASRQPAIAPIATGRRP